jgi:glutamate synthase (NADPH) small chain
MSMGKVTGFMEQARLKERYAPVSERIKHYKEFVVGLDAPESSTQAGRCMDCGIPFCHQGCPIKNVIPDFNHLVYEGRWKEALDVLHQTNNFPEFTGRVCPAPCEAGCTLTIGHEAVRIKSIEYAIVEKGWSEGWVHPQPIPYKTGKCVAVVGSGPCGLAAAQQLARLGYTVTVFEKQEQVGGLLRYGIPDFKLGKQIIDRRIEQMKAEGVIFRTGVYVGEDFSEHASKQGTSWNSVISPEVLLAEFDAVLLAGGAEQPRDLVVPGRELQGVHFAMEFLGLQNRINSGLASPLASSHCLSAKDKHVVVIGGGDTGSDCIGTSHRQGAKSITQFELLPRPPEHENKPLVWPYWALKLRTSTSHEEGCTRRFGIATKAFMGESGHVKALLSMDVEWKNGVMQEIPHSEEIIKADLVLLAMGFTGPIAHVLEAFGVEKDGRGQARASEDSVSGYATSVPRVFAAGDMRRGQSLVVWAIQEGRRAAQAIHQTLQ